MSLTQTNRFDAIFAEFTAGPILPPLDEDHCRRLQEFLWQSFRLPRLRSGPVCEVTADEYQSYRARQPVAARDSWFILELGMQPWLLFWRTGARFFARQLRWEQTCKLAESLGMEAPYRF